MRASRWLRHRAQINRTRYAVRLLVSDVLPSLVGSMQMMNDTLRIQSRTMQDHLKFHESDEREEYIWLREPAYPSHIDHHDDPGSEGREHDRDRDGRQVKP